jgi:hypothetical protein
MNDFQKFYYIIVMAVFIVGYWLLVSYYVAPNTNPNQVTYFRIAMPMMMMGFAFTIAPCLYIGQ